MLLSNPPSDVSGIVFPQVHLLSNLAVVPIARWSLSDHLGIVPSNLADNLLARCYLLGNLGTAPSCVDWWLVRWYSQVYQSVASFYLALPASDIVSTGCCCATAGHPIAAATPPSSPRTKPMGGSSSGTLGLCKKIYYTLNEYLRWCISSVEDGSQSPV